MDIPVVVARYLIPTPVFHSGRVTVIDVIYLRVQANEDFKRDSQVLIQLFEVKIRFSKKNRWSPGSDNYLSGFTPSRNFACGIPPGTFGMPILLGDL
jgi:hypothetical protein